MHDELLSLQRLVLQGCDIVFTRAAITWRRASHGLVWSGTVRGASAAIARVGDEVELAATTLDGRAVEGRAVVTLLDGPEPVLTFSGSGPLRVEGREL